MDSLLHVLVGHHVDVYISLVHSLKYTVNNPCIVVDITKGLQSFAFPSFNWLCSSELQCLY